MDVLDYRIYDIELLGTPPNHLCATVEIKIEAVTKAAADTLRLRIHLEVPADATLSELHESVHRAAAARLPDIARLFGSSTAHELHTLASDGSRLADWMNRHGHSS